MVPKFVAIFLVWALFFATATPVEARRTGVRTTFTADEEKSVVTPT